MVSTSVLIVIAVFALIIGFSLVAWLTEKKRAKGLSDYAKQNGFSFFEKPQDFTNDLAGFSIFRGRAANFLANIFQGFPSSSAYNLLQGEKEGISFKIFNYQYSTGSGKNRHTYIFTVCCTQSQKISVPYFMISHETMFDRIADAVTKQDIDFDNHPDFSKTYKLTGHNQELVRKLFDDDKLVFFEAEKKNIRFSIEAENDKILVHEQKTLWAKDIPGFMEESVKIAKKFENKGF